MCVDEDDERLGRDATLKEPLASEEDETRKPARTKAWCSFAVKTPGGIAEEVPIEFRT